MNARGKQSDQPGRTSASARKGLVQRIVMGTAAIAMIVVATIMLVPPSTAPAGSLRPGTDTPSEVIVRLTGLSPEVLAATGVLPATAARSIQAAESVAASRRADAGTIIDDLVRARSNLALIEQRLRRGQGRTGDAAERLTLRTEVGNLEAQQQAIIDSVMDAAAAELAPAFASRLRAIVANTDRTVPVYMRAIDRSAEEWVELEYSVSSVDVSGRLEEEPDADAARAVADAISDPTVAAAKTGFETHLAAIEASWNAAFAE